MPPVELEKAKLASRRRPINVEVDECRKFIARSEKRIIDLDEERTQEMASLTQARERLLRLEAEQVSDSVAPPPQTILPPPFPVAWTFSSGGGFQKTVLIFF